MIYHFKKSESFEDFKHRKEQVAILRRKKPLDSFLFFKKLLKFSFTIKGNVYYSNAKKDIKEILSNEIPESIQKNPFYDFWVEDMSKICQLFCLFQKEEKISFWIGSQRGCSRYHTDMVPFRLLVTYAGQGTELLPNEAANRKAFLEGKPNEEIVLNNSALKHLNSWDVAIFRGGRCGMLHRSPDSALDGNSSVLMRLDQSSFLDDLRRVNGY